MAPRPHVLALGGTAATASGQFGWAVSPTTLAPGSYEVLCGIPGHAALGMQRPLTVN